MSEMDNEVAPELEVDDADLLEQATPVPVDDEEEYPFGPEETDLDETDEDEEDTRDADDETESR